MLDGVGWKVKGGRRGERMRKDKKRSELKGVTRMIRVEYREALDKLRKKV